MPEAAPVSQAFCEIASLQSCIWPNESTGAYIRMYVCIYAHKKNCHLKVSAITVLNQNIDNDNLFLIESKLLSKYLEEHAKSVLLIRGTYYSF